VPICIQPDRRNEPDRAQRGDRQAQQQVDRPDHALQVRDHAQGQRGHRRCEAGDQLREADHDGSVFAADVPQQPDALAGGDDLSGNRGERENHPEQPLLVRQVPGVGRDRQQGRRDDQPAGQQVHPADGGDRSGAGPDESVDDQAGRGERHDQVQVADHVAVQGRGVRTEEGGAQGQRDEARLHQQERPQPAVLTNLLDAERDHLAQRRSTNPARIRDGHHQQHERNGQGKGDGAHPEQGDVRLQRIGVLEEQQLGRGDHQDQSGADRRLQHRHPAHLGLQQRRRHQIDRADSGQAAEEPQDGGGDQEDDGDGGAEQVAAQGVARRHQRGDHRTDAEDERIGPARSEHRRRERAQQGREGADRIEERGDQGRAAHGDADVRQDDRGGGERVVQTNPPGLNDKPPVVSGAGQFGAVAARRRRVVGSVGDHCRAGRRGLGADRIRADRVHRRIQGRRTGHSAGR
jgi:hypothetical protein